LEAIAQRRSIRRFKADPIPDEVLQRILTAGTQAPSSKNRQPWRFLVVTHGLRPWLAHSIEQNFYALVDTQSIGAAIQNMLLAAQDLGVGSLWICDVFEAYEELCTWLGEPGQMVAAVSLGYADESPAARSRKPVGEVTRWL
jgi:nitroreductase